MRNRTYGTALCAVAARATAAAGRCGGAPAGRNNPRFGVASGAIGGTIEANRSNPDEPLPGGVAVPVAGGRTWTEVTAPVTDPSSADDDGVRTDERRDRSDTEV